MAKVRWGVLGTGKIVHKTGPAIERSGNGVWLGVAGRTRENSEKMASLYGVERAYAHYQELLDDPDIDAVYIALLNHLHEEWAVKAAEAGKHVLLEKPFAMNADEAVRIREAAEKRNVRVMEAHAWRFHPGHAGVKRMVRQGAIGELAMMYAHFSFAADAGSTRLVKEWGGGSLYDVGCYPVAWSRYFMENEPIEADGKAEWDPERGVDLRFAGTLHFPGGRTAHIASALDMRIGSFYTLMGTEGRIDVHFKVTPEELAIVAHGPGEKVTRWSTDRIEFYARQAEAFARAIADGTEPPCGADDAVSNMKAIDALFAAAREGRRVPIG